MTFLERGLRRAWLFWRFPPDFLRGRCRQRIRTRSDHESYDHA